MQRLWTKIALTLAILVWFGYSIIPPEKQLRLGKDLAGGVSLIYAVQVAPGEDAREVISKTIDVLKSRVDPDGIFEITMIPQGQDRIEVQMPLPNERVKALKAVYDAELDKLAAAVFAPDDLERALRLTGDERQTELTRLSAGDAKRAEMLAAAAKAADAANATRAAVEAAKLANAPEAEIDRLAGEAADADVAYAKARDEVLATNLEPREVKQAFERSNRQRKIEDTRGGKSVIETLPSPREEAINRLKSEHPALVETIDRIVAAHAAYTAQRTTLDDPEDLKRLLRGAGVLDFRITVKPGEHADEARLRQELRERGPLNVRASDVAWFKINKIENWYSSIQQMQAVRANASGFFANMGYVVEPYDGEYWMLAYDTRGGRLTSAEGEWKVARAYEGRDQLGRPAIDFQMDTRGGNLLGSLTENHVGNQMAVLLDDQVYTAPRLNSRISTNGQITGEFSREEINYIVQVLAAGSLQAKLSPEPLADLTMAPELGADNLRSGLIAGLISLVAISAFMMFYYFHCGAIAVVCLLANGLLIVGAMALNRAAFTLPGIAGVILTFGMAVDSNVLIFERMREEFLKGADLKTAVRQGYSRALSAIVDGNVTNLIVCVVLGAVGTPEIKGFAITMGIGVVTTLFCALVISRIIFDVGIALGWNRTSMLPLAVPGLQKALTPKVKWLNFRRAFFALSAIYVLVGIGLIAVRGERMLDTEFSGGTVVTLTFKEENGQRVTMTRSEVVDRVNAIAEEAEPGSQLKQLQVATVLAVNPQGDGVTSSQWRIQTLATDGKAVIDAVSRAFADKMQVQPAVSFDGRDTTVLRQAPVYRLFAPQLGADIDRPSVRDDVSKYLGGLAIVMDNIEPVEPLEDLVSRLERIREQPDFSDTLSRVREVRVLEGTRDAVRSAVVLVRDPNLSFFDNEDRWEANVAEREWRLVQESMSRSSTPASVTNIGPTIADTFKAQAVVAIILSFILIAIYVWVRFGSVSYSLASIIPLTHDVLFVLGMIALAEIVHDWPVTQPYALMIGLVPFKIDLNMIAALLTIVGYSLNDTIVVLDRIRELRGKLDYTPAKVINDAVNQTFSRTLITGGGVLFSTVMLFILGDESVKGFAYALFLGVLIGTYSSVAISAPFVWSKNKDRSLNPTGDTALPR